MIYQLYFFTKLVKEATTTEDHLPTTSLQTPPRPIPLTLKTCHGTVEAGGSSGLEPGPIFTAPARGQQGSPSPGHQAPPWAQARTWA